MLATPVGVKSALRYVYETTTALADSSFGQVVLCCRSDP